MRVESMPPLEGPVTTDKRRKYRRAVRISSFVPMELPLFVMCAAMLGLSSCRDRDLATLGTFAVLACAWLWMQYRVSWRLIRRMEPWLSRLRSDAVEEEIHEKRVTEYDRRNDIGRLT